MAAGIILCNRDSNAMRPAYRYLQMIREGRDGLTAHLAVMTQYIDGGSGGSGTAANFDLLASAATFAQGDYADANAAAKASYDEIASVVGKLTTDSSVSNVFAAVNQACAKHGI